MFSFITCALRVIFKKSMPIPRLKRLTPMFSSKSFIILILTFRSLTHCRLILCVWCEVGVQLHSLARGCLLVPAAKSVLSLVNLPSTLVGCTHITVSLTARLQ